MSAIYKKQQYAAAIYVFHFILFDSLFSFYWGRKTRKKERKKKQRKKGKLGKEKNEKGKLGVFLLFRGF